MKRKIVRIDENKCDGCGLCIAGCHEGALQLIDGKARLVSDIYCDGLGDCLGECPRDAIIIEEREAAEYDELAVQARQQQAFGVEKAAGGCHAGLSVVGGVGGGCPGARAMQFGGGGVVSSAARSEGEDMASELRQWPVQLHLVPPVAPWWDDTDILVAADCVAHAYGDFHRELLRGRKLIIACPKLDETDNYLAKLSAIFRDNRVRSVTVAHMEVPCCTGIVRLVESALARSGKEIPLRRVTIGVQGRKLSS